MARCEAAALSTSARLRYEPASEEEKRGPTSSEPDGWLAGCGLGPVRFRGGDGPCSLRPMIRSCQTTARLLHVMATRTTMGESSIVSSMSLSVVLSVRRSRCMCNVASGPTGGSPAASLL